MIIAITPNPALDVGGIVDEIIPDEKTYVRNETRNPGGNSINSARVIKRLDVPVTATGFVGGSAGRELCDLLEAEGIHRDFVDIAGHTRVNMTVTSLRTTRQTRLSFPGPDVTGEEVKYLVAKVKQCNATPPTFALIGGSFPPGFEVNNAREMICSLNHSNIPVVVDVPAKRLRHLVGEKLFMIKPNLHEFQQLVGSDCMSLAEIIERARPYADHIDLVCISSVDGGALLVTRRGVWIAKGPKVEVKSTVGAGDSMVGGVVACIWKLLNERGSTEYSFDALTDDDLALMLRWGMASALACISVAGTVPGGAEAMLNLVNQIEIKTLENEGTA